MVEAFGGKGYHVTDPAELTPTLRRALADDAVTCIDVPIDPDFTLRAGVAKLTV